MGGEQHPGWTGPPGDRRAYHVADRTEFFSGGLGVVYRATLETDVVGFETGIEVAVKQFTGDVTDERFSKLEERAAALRQVEHPGVARLVEVFVGPPFAEGPVEEEEATERYCVHVWVEGTPLSERCLDADPSEILEWGAQAADALDHLHAHPAGPFAHRDVHPGNLVITTEGQAVLIDYDTILVEGPEDIRTRMPLPGTRFAPRERAPGLAGAQRDDRWSLACTVLYALAGDPTGSLGLVDACEEAESALRGAVADPTGVVLELKRVLDGEDPGTAGSTFRRVERPMRRRRRLLVRSGRRPPSWEEPLAGRNGLLGTTQRRVALVLAVLILAASGVTGAVIANQKPRSAPPRGALGVPVAKRTTSTTTTSTSTTTTTTTTAPITNPSPDPSVTSGTVSDPSGNPVANAYVIGLNSLSVAQTDASGHYSMPCQAEPLIAATWIPPIDSLADSPTLGYSYGKNTTLTTTAPTSPGLGYSFSNGASSADDPSAIVSCNGQPVNFILPQGGNADIEIQDSSGNPVTDVYDQPPPDDLYLPGLGKHAAIFDPTISPDGHQVLYQMGAGTLRIDGTTSTLSCIGPQVTSDPSVAGADVTITPGTTAYVICSQESS